MKRTILTLITLCLLHYPLLAQEINYNSTKRYKGVSFSIPNTEGQMLSYVILPEGNNTVALVRPEDKKTATTTRPTSSLPL